MIDLHDKKKRGHVLKAIKTSKEAMVPFRRVRKEFLRDYVGSWYSEDGARAKTLYNLMNQTARIYTVALAANNPSVLVSTDDETAIPFARRFEANINKLISDMELDVTFRAIVLDAFFCIGCGVVTMRDTDTRFHGILESEEDVWLDPGEPWFNRVSMDELILDMSAKELSKMRFCGHMFRADFEKVMDEPSYDKKVVAKLSPTSKSSVDSPEFARDIASGGVVDDDELKPMVWLQSIWIPENKSVATMAVDLDLPPLLEREWTGSQGGPYKFLSLGNTPDNVIPTSPASNLKGLHDLTNRLHVRMEEDSDAHRVVNVYPPSEAMDAEKLRTAARNSWIRMQDPKSIQQVELGGVDQRDQALALFIQEEFDRMAGNLSAMGGLGPQASTVGQEEIIQGQVSRTEADMRMAVVKFASEVVVDLGHLMWGDDQLEIRATRKWERSGLQMDYWWTPDNRQGGIDDYRFWVEPYSMVFKTPEQKLQELFQVLQQLAPLWPMFQASGATLDAQSIVDEIARLKNRPEFKKFITVITESGMLGGDENTIRQSPITSRETIRRNIPTGGTQSSRASVMSQVLGGNSKPQVNSQQMASMSRRPA